MIRLPVAEDHPILFEVLSTLSEIKKGLLTVFSSDGTYMLWSIYSLDGMEKLSRALISNLEFLSLIPILRGLFDKCLKEIEAQKDLYYATLTFIAFPLYIEMENGRPIGLKLPRLPPEEGNEINWFLILMSISGVFDTCQFLSKYGVVQFGFISSKMGAIGVFLHLNHIPVVESLFDGKPKEFFVVLASVVEFYQACKQTNKLWQAPYDERDDEWIYKKWEVIFKYGGSLGKIIGISCYRKCMGQTWLYIVAVVGTNAQLFKFILLAHHRRLKRMYFP